MIADTFGVELCPGAAIAQGLGFVDRLATLGNRNIVERVSHDAKRRTSRFTNTIGHGEANAAEHRLQEFALVGPVSPDTGSEEPLSIFLSNHPDRRPNTSPSGYVIFFGSN